MMKKPQRVLFLCEGNADRSQMAEALLKHFGSKAYEVHSAGLEPRMIDPLAIVAMQEMGIDISGQREKHLNEYMEMQFDYVITLCEQVKSSCLAFPRDAHVLHWQCNDPGQSKGTEDVRLSAFRQSANSLSGKIQEWINHP